MPVRLWRVGGTSGVSFQVCSYVRHWRPTDAMSVRADADRVADSVQLKLRLSKPVEMAELTPRSIALDRQLAYLVLRLSLGINILIHGSGRILGTGADAFASKTMGEFTTTYLPPGVTYAFLMALPFAELLLGTLITVGLFTRWALTLGGLLITALIFGTALRSDWATVGIQMIYSITYYLLLVNRTGNRFSLDALLHRTQS